MNDLARYLATYNEMCNEDFNGTMKWISECRKKAFQSYPDEEKIRYCTLCGEPLVYTSISYDEGFHIDSCL